MNEVFGVDATGSRARLIYLSPLPYKSFSQRPHRFADCFHEFTGGEVLWIDPYPSRLPRLSDLRRPCPVADTSSGTRPWLKTSRLRSLPIEPLYGGSRVNRLFWEDTLNEIRRFSEAGQTFLAIGKPSAFANLVLDRLQNVRSVYDMMDNFPAFYSGRSARVMERHEKRIIENTQVVVCSSTNLKTKALQYRPDAYLLLNALDPDPSIATMRHMPREKKARVFGYVGTIASWFDWDLVRDLALARSNDIIRLIGPLSQRSPNFLPANVELRPPISHHEAMQAMREFDVALIPFKNNSLTWGVDPIKYYEYRATGLPILTTRFGEMTQRTRDDGVFVIDHNSGIESPAHHALDYKIDEITRKRFIAENSWSARFRESILADFYQFATVFRGRNTR